MGNEVEHANQDEEISYKDMWEELKEHITKDRNLFTEAIKAKKWQDDARLKTVVRTYEDVLLTMAWLEKVKKDD